jgi:hypothetical protein
VCVSHDHHCMGSELLEFLDGGEIGEHGFNGVVVHAAALGDGRDERLGLLHGVGAQVADDAELELVQLVAGQHLAHLLDGVRVGVAADALHVLQRLLEHLRDLSGRVVRQLLQLLVLALQHDRHLRVHQALGPLEVVPQPQLARVLLLHHRRPPTTLQWLLALKQLC